MDKRWDFRLVEEKYKRSKKRWESEGDQLVFIDTPPPYPGPNWHIGAVLSYTLQDFVARSLRKLGYKVVFPCCFDGNGIPIELYLEKYKKIYPKDYPREEFVKICRKVLDEWRANMKEILVIYLCSMDYDNIYNTDDHDYRKFTQETFRKLWNEGLIYKGKRPSLYCPKCKTVIGESEVEYKTEKGKLVYIRFKLKDSEDYITIATTRPEYLGACKLILVHPDDERYKNYHGKKAIVPIYNREVEIRPHPNANPEFGTGAVMICSFGDWSDVQIFREFGLEPVEIIDLDGKFKIDPIRGLSTKDAREKMIEVLEREGFVEKIEDIEHDVPVHERCETEIEIVPIEAYFLKQLEFVEDLKEIIKYIKFYPERYRQNLVNWINSLKTDWPISRNRYYATEVPVWICEKCNHVELGEGYVIPWKEEKVCPKCGAKMRGETDVLDTWMDSSISVLYLVKSYCERENLDWREAFRKAITIRPQGYDIIRTWLYYSILRVYQLEGTNAFDWVIINGMGLDKHGRKMSKRYGNVIDPVDLVEKYGADAIRFWFAMEVQVGEDYRINEDKIAGISKFFNKLWNIARYIKQYPKVDSVKDLYPTDEWIVEEAKLLEKQTIEHLKNFEFCKVARELYNFVWDKFANHYIELSKNRAKNGDQRVYYTLYYVMDTVLRILNIFSPATTWYLYKELFGEDVEVKKLNDPGKIKHELIFKGKKLLEFNKEVWKIKTERGMKLKDEIQIEIPKELKDFEEDLKAMHHIVT